MASGPADVSPEMLAKIHADIARWYPGIWTVDDGPACHCGLPQEHLISNGKVPTVQCEPMECPRHVQ